MDRIVGYDNRLSGATLTEVLVMMIVSGIVFLSVMDGLRLFRRHTMNVAWRITENSRFYDGYYRLEDLVVRADSLTAEDTGVVCWRGGSQSARIVLQDSVLMAEYGTISDTLLVGVGIMRTARRQNAVRIDSLSVVMHTDEKSLTITFPVTSPVQVVAMDDITENEKEYEYE